VSLTPNDSVFSLLMFTLTSPPLKNHPRFLVVGLAYQGKDIVFRFIVEL
jgi:hypothetical protein